MRTTIDSLLSWFRTLPASRRTLLILIAFCMGGLAVSWISRPTISTGRGGFPGTSSFTPIPRENQLDAELKAQWERIKQSRKAVNPATTAVGDNAIGPDIGELGYATPMIAHAAELAVSTKEFTHFPSTPEEILEPHHGYSAKPRMGGQPAARTLTPARSLPPSVFPPAGA